MSPSRTKCGTVCLGKDFGFPGQDSLAVTLTLVCASSICHPAGTWGRKSQTWSWNSCSSFAISQKVLGSMSEVGWHVRGEDRLKSLTLNRTVLLLPCRIGGKGCICKFNVSLSKLKQLIYIILVFGIRPILFLIHLPILFLFCRLIWLIALAVPFASLAKPIKVCADSSTMWAICAFTLCLLPVLLQHPL